MSKILVLEDQPGWDALVTSAVRHGRLPECAVYHAKTYGHALRLIEEEDFCVALLDYSLEQTGSEEDFKTGLDVAEELRRMGSRATILLITLAPDPERLEQRCETLGVRFVEKGRPDLEAEIVREVQEALQGDPPPR